MVIRLTSKRSDPHAVVAQIKKRFEKSRLDIQEMYPNKVTNIKRFKGGEIRIYGIRLKQARLYRGNAPVSNPNWPTKIRNSKFLEALDWIEALDLINDVLDDMGVSAECSTRVIVFRLGNKRRTHYEFYGAGIWMKQPPSNDDREWSSRFLGTKVHPASRFQEYTLGAYRTVDNTYTNK